MKKLFFVVVALLVASVVSYAQLTTGKLGISTDPSAGSLGAAYALSENMRIDAGVHILSTSVTGSSATAIGLNASVKMYNAAMENVTYYYGGKFGFSSNGGTPSSTTIELGALAGAEYWFSPRFTVGGQVNFGFKNFGASGAKTTEIGTMGMNTVWTWWFN